MYVYSFVYFRFFEIMWFVLTGVQEVPIPETTWLRQAHVQKDRDRNGLQSDDNYLQKGLRLPRGQKIF